MSMTSLVALDEGCFKLKNQIHQNGNRNPPHVKAKDAEQVAKVLKKIAKRKSTLITSVAMTYVMHKAPYVFPACGDRKVEHLTRNIETLGLVLDSKDFDEIEQAYSFDVGFPHNMLADGPQPARRPEDNILNKRLRRLDYLKGLQPIAPHVGDT